MEMSSVLNNQDSEFSALITPIKSHLRPTIKISSNRRYKSFTDPSRILSLSSGKGKHHNDSLISELSKKHREKSFNSSMIPIKTGFFPSITIKESESLILDAKTPTFMGNGYQTPFNVTFRPLERWTVDQPKKVRRFPREIFGQIKRKRLSI
ncbi:unnamed protein product [Blepharisma stoltei]|uniref:Uncharacterized protein n=1 Tax=Blepharisma stoltei TaxID=1481888 RepID=A0AAU9IRY9_9CILI|nr:unnamed protein product [Blepharisma stoltei]